MNDQLHIHELGNQIYAFLKGSFWVIMILLGSIFLVGESIEHEATYFRETFGTLVFAVGLCILLGCRRSIEERQAFGWSASPRTWTIVFGLWFLIWIIDTGALTHFFSSIDNLIG